MTYALYIEFAVSSKLRMHATYSSIICQSPALSFEEKYFDTSDTQPFGLVNETMRLLSRTYTVRPVSASTTSAQPNAHSLWLTSLAWSSKRLFA